MVAAPVAPLPSLPRPRDVHAASRGPGLRLLPADPPTAAELGRACGVGPAIGQVLLHRGITSEDAARAFLAPRLGDLTPPDGMRDRSAAAERLARAVRRRERVVVFGDYDVDGTTSATIVGEVLEALGGDARVLCANRFVGGYGFSAPALERALEAGAQLIVTCDCGSADHERIEAARRRGVDVVVVDHHLVPETELPALAFLNPHRPDCAFPYKSLCSAGLALSLAAAVRAELASPLDLRPWLDLVALGTIADVVPLDGDNRRLVRAGLARLAAASPRPGVRALREVARLREGSPIGGVDVAFRLAPRLNAAGRLGDPERTVQLLRAATLPEARSLAEALERVNRERRTIERRITQEALAQAEEVYGERVDGGVVVYAEGWHRGVVGIVAARVAERVGAPAVVVAVEDGVGHGSGRTPDGFDLHAALGRCRGDLRAFGGHAAAAGVTVSADRLEAFRAAFDDACRADRQAAPPLEATRVIDVVQGPDLPLPTAGELMLLEPVGEGNREATFLIPDAAVTRAGTVGSGHLKLALEVAGRPLSAFGWEMGERAERVGSRVALHGALRPDPWRGGDAVELRIDGFVD
ncbi:MAG: single-stranded-DNA-specific exonuclease RecJ [Sandaracinaceae bacterium]